MSGTLESLKKKVADSPISDIAVEVTVGLSVIGIAGLAFKVATWVVTWISEL